MELLYKQFNVDKSHFQQLIGDGTCLCQAYPTFFRTTMQNLFLSLSQKTFMKNFLSTKTTMYLTIHHSTQWKIANFP